MDSGYLPEKPNVVSLKVLLLECVLCSNYSVIELMYLVLLGGIRHRTLVNIKKVRPPYEHVSNK